MNGRNRNQGSNQGYGRRNDYDRGYDQQNYGRRFEGDRVFEGQQRSTASEYPEYMDQQNSYNSQPFSRADRTEYSSQQRSDYGAERYGNDYTGQSSDRDQHQTWGRQDMSSGRGYRGQEQSFGRSSQGGRSTERSMDQWSPSNGTDYRADRDYDQYSRSSSSSYGNYGSDYDRSNMDQRSHDNSSNRGYNQGFGQSYGMGYGETYGSYQSPSPSSRSSRDNYQGRDESSWGRRDSQSAFGRADYGQRDWERSSRSEQQGRFSGVAPKGYRRSDERIKEELSDALTQDQHIDASEIDLTVESGVVTLKGTVSERRMKRLAEDCAERIRGVSDVRNELRVQAESSTGNKKTWSDSMTTSDGKSSDKNDTDTATARGGKSSSRSSTESRNYQS